MALQDNFLAIRTKLQRYWTRRVLLVWLVLTILIGGYVYVRVRNVLPVVMLFGGFPLNEFVLGAVVVAIGGVALAIWAGRPLYALGGAFFIGVAALSVSLGCPGEACNGEKQLPVFFEWTLLGPTISANYDAGSCVFNCPHTVELVPLLIGYLLIGKTIIQDESDPDSR